MLLINLKKHLPGFLVLCSCLLAGQAVFAQKIEKLGESKTNENINNYRRSSLHTMIISNDQMPRTDWIEEAFIAAPFPDKYNDHTMQEKIIRVSVAEEEDSTAKKKKDNDPNFVPQIENFFHEQKLANKMVAKWFNRSPEGAFDMSLIQERGFYDASAQDLNKAVSTERGTSSLADAGEDLIANTFVVVNYSKFVSNEPYAAMLRDIAKEAAAKLPEMAREIANGVADAAYEKAKEGYSVWTNAYLYQLAWNDSIEAVFYKDLWVNASNIDSNRVKAFDESDIFSLELLGSEKARSLVTGLGSNAESDTMIIKSATVKSIDAVYAKLQKKFERFRTKTPLISIEPLAAKIGMKEGVEKGDKFEVLEASLDPTTGKMTYKRKAIIKVDHNHIWDNRYRLDQGKPIEELADTTAVSDSTAVDTTALEVSEPVEEEEYTTFKGKTKGLSPGYLIRQIN